MKFYVGVTDNQWFDFLRRIKDRSPDGVLRANFLRIRNLSDSSIRGVKKWDD